MSWTIPDKGEGANDIQSILFQEYLDVLAAGISGVDCVLSGLAVTAQGSPNMTVAVAVGVAVSNGVSFAVAGANGTISAADGTNPRIDLVVINSSGAIAVRAGTAAAAPKPPARTANDVVIAAVYVPASDTTIAANQITDMRVLRPGPKVYRALLTQTGTSAPTATVLENTIGAIVWTRTAVGSYEATLTGAFVASKTFVMVALAWNGDLGIPVMPRTSLANAPNVISLTAPGSDGSLYDEALTDTAIEILVYP